VIVLLSDTLVTGNSMHAFAHSVHAVVNKADLSQLAKIIQQAIAETSLFMATYRDTQNRIAQGKV
jgi:hypothetical protein